MAGARLVLDSGAVSALADADPRALAWAAIAIHKQMPLGIPAPVLAETTTGQKSDARVRRLIAPNETVLDTTAEVAFRAGRLRFRSRMPDATIDALIVATSMSFAGSIILTGDPDDIGRLASHADDPLSIAVRDVRSKPQK